MERDQKPEGYWISIGISIGTGLGVALGLALGNLALGIALGIAIGAAVGAGREQSKKDESRPLTAREKRLLLWAVGIGALVLAVVVVWLLLLR